MRAQNPSKNFAKLGVGSLMLVQQNPKMLWANSDLPELPKFGAMPFSTGSASPSSYCCKSGPVSSLKWGCRILCKLLPEYSRKVRGKFLPQPRTTQLATTPHISAQQKTAQALGMLSLVFTGARISSPEIIHKIWSNIKGLSPKFSS